MGLSTVATVRGLQVVVAYCQRKRLHFWVLDMIQRSVAAPWHGAVVIPASNEAAGLQRDKLTHLVKAQ